MRDLKNKLTSGKNTKNIQRRKGKSFGYQILGFGSAGASGPSFVKFTYLTALELLLLHVKVTLSVVVDQTQ